ncbi:MAG: tRNA uridine(34) 5-carboxymethylaminomethyl modification radical SAM/GNAT enzyme Elp3 [Propionibacteriaceae bacterium]|nr:tRNA uridine(34) 5-carboxymethylaminomethyl modification radical SAM/GNAT enzyme Elp3 [Propionibacteriaceae bacterium]
MDDLLRDIITAVRELAPGEELGDRALIAIIHRHNKSLPPGEKHFAKKWILPYYHQIKRTDPHLWQTWQVDPEVERRLTQTLQMKPRRNASGVTTITVITKPWRCTNDCLYCPSDVTMPRSYLREEPACQRAQQNYFDPYLQVRSRLATVEAMGHTTDKIELIVLGGTWSDYPSDYQAWFIKELFAALNDDQSAEDGVRVRRERYYQAGLSRDRATIDAAAHPTQTRVDHGELSYNQAIISQYVKSDVWAGLAEHQRADIADVETEHRRNEEATRRVVGLCVETRPDKISSPHLTWLRRLGCTKVQIGIQSLNSRTLRMNNRTTTIESIRESFDWLRLFGFKVHTHAMLNLLGSSPSADIADYTRLVTEPDFCPDEVKLYPCSLVRGTKLCSHFDDGSWRPYTDDELLEVLSACVMATPAHTRISRMVRDISAGDIVAGNTKSNFRETVESRLTTAGAPVDEIRFREISTQAPNLDDVRLDVTSYPTHATQEHFLQWVTPTRQIAGFLRLSLPKPDHIAACGAEAPIRVGEAMIREVHVYGRATALHRVGASAQHLGLGRKLIDMACQIAYDQGYERINVISAVGTRQYYRRLGFSDAGLYQQKTLSGIVRERG